MRPITATYRLQLHARQAVRNSTGTRAPVTLEVHTQDAERTEFFGHFARGKRSGFEPFRDVRPQIACAELFDGVADRLLLV